MASWPVGLPQAPDQQGYQEGPPNVLLRTEMDAGPAKVRPRFSAGVRKHKMTMQLDTLAEVEILDVFYVTTLNNGADTFTWVRPRTGAAATFRFVAPPVYTPINGPIWRASWELEELP